MAYEKEKKKGKKTDEDCFSYIDNLVQDSQEYTGTWASNQEKWHKLRMRIKKEKSFPFIGSSNLRMPTAETKIRKLKAALYNVIFGVRPVVQAIPKPGASFETALKIEKFIDHLIMDVIKLPNKAIIAIDQCLEKGFYLMKPFWRTEICKRVETIKMEDLKPEEVEALMSGQIPEDQMIDYAMQMLDVDKSSQVLTDNKSATLKAVRDLQGGKKETTITYQDVVYDYPDVALVSPERCFVNTDCGVDAQDAQFIVHEYMLPVQQVKYNVDYMGWSKKILEDLNDYNGLTREDINTLTDMQKDVREGIERLNFEGIVRIWEYYGWYDMDGKGTQEKCVITCLPDFGTIARKIRLPYDSHRFPFIKLMYELIDNRWFAHRGIPEIIEDIIKEIDVQHNQKIDNQTIRNAPMFVYRAGQVNPNTVKFVPGQGIPVNGMNPLNDTLNVLNSNNPNVEYSYEREQMLLESKVEELIGQVDFTLQSMINRRQPRTLGEVQLQNQNMQQVFSLDASVFASQMSDLFGWIWELWCQYGNDAYEFAYFGKDGWEQIRLTREEVQGKYKIVVRGNDSNTNPQVRLQKAQQVLMAITNPAFLQTGVITPNEVARGLALFYQELDVPNWQNLVVQQPQPQQPPQPKPIDLIKPKYSDLTDAEQAQVLSSGGIQPDGQGRMMKKQIELEDRDLELAKMFDGALDKSIPGA